LEATITLEYGDAEIADAIAKAVSPDNFKTPVGLAITTSRKDSRVLTEVKAEGKLATFIATIDDLLFCVSTAEKTLRTINKTPPEPELNQK
jgi:tRNA threonylcarbamoyladenosine modification (KEOPS) complex  Pcc1 subunit